MHFCFLLAPALNYIPASRKEDQEFNTFVCQNSAVGVRIPVPAEFGGRIPQAEGSAGVKVGQGDLLRDALELDLDG